MPLGCPPEWVGSESMELLEVCPDSPSFVIGQRVSVLLEEGVDSRNTSIPTVLQIFQSKSSVGSGSFLSLHGVFRPYPSRVQELGLPRLHVTIQVWDELILFMGHTRSEMGDTARIGLFGPSQIGLRDENEAHRQHTKTTELFGRVKDGGRESGRHFTVETDLDSGLDLVLGLDQGVEELVGVYHCFTVVGHQPDQGSVPFVAAWSALFIMF